MTSNSILLIDFDYISMKAFRPVSASLGAQIQVVQRQTAHTSALRHTRCVQMRNTKAVSTFIQRRQQYHRHFSTTNSCKKLIDKSSAPASNNIMATSDAHADHTWEQQPPYAYSEDGEAAFEKKLEGKCQCGRVRYWLKSDKPLSSKFCHCRGCQVLHGK